MQVITLIESESLRLQSKPHQDIVGVLVSKVYMT
jgi:hypothetical protein